MAHGHNNVVPPHLHLRSAAAGVLSTAASPSYAGSGPGLVEEEATSPQWPSAADILKDILHEDEQCVSRRVMDRRITSEALDAEFTFVVRAFDTSGALIPGPGQVVAEEWQDHSLQSRRQWPSYGDMICDLQKRRDQQESMLAEDATENMRRIGSPGEASDPSRAWPPQDAAGQDGVERPRQNQAEDKEGSPDAPAPTPRLSSALWRQTMSRLRKKMVTAKAFGKLVEGSNEAAASSSSPAAATDPE